MAEIRTVLAVVRDAEARCREIDGQLLPVGTAYLETADGPDKAARAADVDRIVAAHQQALEARSAAWERMQRYTVSEIERARESGSLV